MKLPHIALVLTVCALKGFGQAPLVTQYANRIAKEGLHDHLSILASDALEGRETGHRGQKMAAAFIENHFRAIGLAPIVNTPSGKSYQQRFNLYQSKSGEVYFRQGNKKWNNYTDLVYYGRGDNQQEEKITLEFLGDQAALNDNTADLKDKAVVLYVKPGWGNWSESYLEIVERKAKLAVLVYQNGKTGFEEVKARLQRSLSSGRLYLEKPGNQPGQTGIVFTHPAVAAGLFGTTPNKMGSAIEAYHKGKKNALKKIKPTQMVYRATTEVRTITSENVLGFLEGTDKKDEVIVVTAHYDHIGRQGDEINNGADDDGSGTAAVMEIARMFTQAKADGNGPRRSILFMTVTGEEKGLLGSSYYVDNPVIPLEKTVTNLNIDMIGRIDPEHKDNPNYVYLVGSDKLSSTLHQISEQTNSQYTNLAIDYTYNSKAHPSRIYYRSDHWNFAKNNIPVIFYFNGTHEDYHQPTDTVDKINFNILSKRTQLVFYTAWALANRNEKVALDKTDP